MRSARTFELTLESLKTTECRRLKCPSILTFFLVGADGVDSVELEKDEKGKSVRGP